MKVIDITEPKWINFVKYIKEIYDKSDSDNTANGSVGKQK